MTVEYAPHGAKWSKHLAAEAARIGAAYLPPGSLVWDCCAGTGQMFHDVIGPACGWSTFGSEIQPGWANWTRYEGPTEPDGWPTLDALLRPEPGPIGTLCADSLTLPERLHGHFDGGLVSWVFWNRFTDRYLGLSDYKPGTRKCKACKGTGRSGPDDHCIACAGEGKVTRPPAVKTHQTPGGPVVRPDRHGYSAMYGEPLHANNAGHAASAAVWQYLTGRLVDVLLAGIRPGGFALMEMKDSLEDKGETRHWNVDWLLGVLTAPHRPCKIVGVYAPDAAGQRNGANRDLRIDHTQIVVVQRV